MNLEPLLYQQNPQWLTTIYNKPEKDWFVRSQYKQINGFLEKRVCIALTGLRRVGKSTLLNQLKYQLEKRINPKYILFFSFEKSQTKYDPLVLREILNWYFDTFLQTPPKFLKHRVVVFFDEIQYIPDWQDVIKTFYDLNLNIKFILSGSSSLFIKKKAIESLAGRIIDIKIPPLSFSEYLSLKKTNVNNENINKYFSAHPNLVNSLFEEYLDRGQFPELVNEKYNIEQSQIYLSSIEDKVLEQDLPKLFPIKRIDIVRLIFTYLKQNHSELFEFKNITNDMGINLKTTIKYFNYLKKSYLIDYCFNQTKQLLKMPRVAKKIYLTSTNFSLRDTPKKVENYVFNIFSSQFSTHFFRLNNFEVDFVIKTKNGLIPIEVKYANKLQKDDFDNLVNYAKNNKIKQAVLVSKNNKELIKIDNITIKIIPACLFNNFVSNL